MKSDLKARVHSGALRFEKYENTVDAKPYNRMVAVSTGYFKNPFVTSTTLLRSIQINSTRLHSSQRKKKKQDVVLIRRKDKHRIFGFTLLNSQSRNNYRLFNAMRNAKSSSAFGR